MHIHSSVRPPWTLGKPAWVGGGRVYVFLSVGVILGLHAGFQGFMAHLYELPHRIDGLSLEEFLTLISKGKGRGKTKGREKGGPVVLSQDWDLFRTVVNTAWGILNTTTTIHTILRQMLRTPAYINITLVPHNTTHIQYIHQHHNYTLYHHTISPHLSLLSSNLSSLLTSLFPCVSRLNCLSLSPFILANVLSPFVPHRPVFLILPLPFFIPSFFSSSSTLYTRPLFLFPILLLLPHSSHHMPLTHH